jgi:RND family efflux transporter MFP subunit
MKTTVKLFRKFTGITILLIVFALIVVYLFNVKREKETALQKLTEYNQVVPVQTIVAASKNPVQTFSESGRFRSSKSVDVISKIHGNVLNVNVLIGQYVQAGEVLIEVEKGTLQSHYELAKLTLENATNDLKRFEELVKEDAVTKLQYEAVRLGYQNAITNFELVKEQLDNTVIIAPVSGYITQRNIEKGSYILPGIPLVSISQISELLFMVQVSENDVLLLKKNDRVQIRPSANQNDTIVGLIREIAVNNSLSGRYDILIALENPSSIIRPGMNGVATFSIHDLSKQIIIPRKCIVGSVLDPRVFVLSGDSVLLKDISASLLDENSVIVNRGISEGDKIIVTGQINLEEGTKVKVI